MKILINYANERYRPAQKLNTWTGIHIGKFDKIYNFTSNDIPDAYKEIHKDIFKHPRGNGLWLWKPYLIDYVIKQCKEGDNIFYCDSGAFFIRNPKSIFDKLCNNSPIYACNIPLLESCFTKDICFQKMNCIGSNYTNTNQIIATYFAIRVCNNSRKFIKEWLEYCEDIELLSPSESKDTTTNEYYLNRFVAHREDQSIFSLLFKRYTYKPHKDISQRGWMPWTYYNPNYAYIEPKHSNENYKTILFLHKLPNPNFSSLLKFVLRNIHITLKYIFKF